MNEFYFQTKDLVVGYNNKPLIKNINVCVKKGEILTLIGPNGSGKSTILKSITKHLSFINGVVYIEGKDLNQTSQKELSKKLSVVLTERIKPELMTCYDVVASGRYPYTNSFGKLTDNDKKIVIESLEKVQAIDIMDKDFMETSDGQKQRIMLARAICQEPEIIVLDEPTSYLDIRHKIELLSILHKMAKEQNIAIIMSLHEIDLAAKISDKVMCVKGETISCIGKPEEIFTKDIICELYDMKEGSYNNIFGSVELAKPTKKASVFVIGGNGYGAKFYRILQQRNIGFISGILYENDVDYQLSTCLAEKTIIIPAFEDITPDILEEAKTSILECDLVINSGTPIKKNNIFNFELIEFAIEKGIKVIDISKGDIYE